MAYLHGKRFARCVKLVSTKFPLEGRLRIRTVRLRDMFGYYEYSDDYECPVSGRKIVLHTIRISRHMTVAVAIETFIHEYAHALDFQKNGHPPEVHNTEWGKIYARLYRYYWKCIEREKEERRGNAQPNGQTDSET